MRATTHTSIARPLNAWWRIGVSSSVAPVVTVTPPDGTPVDALVPLASPWLVEILLDQPGRWVAHAESDSGAADFTAWVRTIVPAGGMPDVAALVAYMGDTSFSEEELADALAAEAAAQRKAIAVPAAYGADLANALCRRAQRNLAMRGLPLALPQSDEGGSLPYLPGRDPEVRRLEAPYRRIGIG